MTTSSGIDNQPHDGARPAIPDIAIPNGELGEVAIELGGETILLRPTFDCLQRIETGTGKEVSALHSRLVHDGAIGVADLVVVIACGMKAGGVAAPGDLGERIYQQGIVEITTRAAEFLAGAMAGPIKPLSAGGDEAQDEPGWRHWRQVALVTFKWTLTHFRVATPHEFWDAYEGLRATLPDSTASDSQFMSRSELDDLMTRVPDKPHAA